MEKTNKVLLINKPYDVKITEIPLRDLEYDEVLIRVHAAAICINDVRVIGAGPMGFLHVLLVQLKGVRVTVSEPKADRRENALAHGAAYAIDPSTQDLVTEVMKLTDGLGVKTVFCATPNPEPAGDAIACCMPSGTVVMFSSLHPNTPVEVNLGHIHSTQKNITGALNGSFKTFWQAIQLLNKGIFDPSPFIEDIYDYHDFDEAMACAMRDDTYKVVIRITD